MVFLPLASFRYFGNSMMSKNGGNVLYKTDLGEMHNSSIEAFIHSPRAVEERGKVQLILTSPPYPLVSPKAYGNRVGEDYKKWMISVFRDLVPLLSADGSLVVEIGNAWDKGQPTMSTLPLETLMALKLELGLEVCQQFIWHNPSKLPGPANWVNKSRIRVKDSFTHFWWFSRTPFPKADNRRVLEPYKEGMVKLLARKSYNHGTRPSGHVLGSGFLKENAGAIPPSVLSIPNTAESASYRQWCKQRNLPQHPARMPSELAKFFINFLTEENDLIFDPFGGSNTTGAAAESLNRRWLVTELDEDYALGSAGRFGDLIKEKGDGWIAA